MAVPRSAAQLLLLCKEAVDAPTLLKHYITLHPLSKGVALDVMQKYLRFMALKVHAGDIHTSGSPSYFPSPMVDDMWRCHILDTVAYKAFCATIVRQGVLVHHSLKRLHDSAPVHAARLAKLTAAY
eukprot:TRINITY_DN6012_c0_g1_i1.p2 TRINITY_DN6012_c0_g1~~TRINITY_DN6012_c0_g1_i1.p2  ORF type:complete len:126 (+),score=14.98 TRINITY_DN6012_c0_g1_i1:152-529(+)